MALVAVTAASDPDGHLQEALDAIFNDSRMVAVVNVLLPLHLRRGTGFWWQVLEMLMELTAPHQVSVF